MATFGYSTVPSSTGNTSAGTLQEASITSAAGSSSPASDGTITKLSAYLGNSSAGNVTIGLAVWADSAGSPGALLANFGTHVITAGQSLGFVDYTGTLAVTSGTVYWLGYYCSGDGGNHAQLGRDVAAANTSKFRTGVTPPSNPFGAVTSDSNIYAIYATYTPTAASDTAQPTGLSGQYVLLISGSN